MTYTGQFDQSVPIHPVKPIIYYRIISFSGGSLGRLIGGFRLIVSHIFEEKSLIETLIFLPILKIFLYDFYLTNSSHLIFCEIFELKIDEL